MAPRSQMPGSVCPAGSVLHSASSTLTRVALGTGSGRELLTLPTSRLGACRRRPTPTPRFSTPSGPFHFSGGLKLKACTFPLSTPACGSMATLIRLGPPEASASRSAAASSSAVPTATPRPPKACASRS